MILQKEHIFAKNTFPNDGIRSAESYEI